VPNRSAAADAAAGAGGTVRKVVTLHFRIAQQGHDEGQGARRKSVVKGNSRLACSSAEAGGTSMGPALWPMGEKRARRRLSAS
jgi:hypothetical protein